VSTISSALFLLCFDAWGRPKTNKEKKFYKSKKVFWSEEERKKKFSSIKNSISVLFISSWKI
jgi:hypothetical protein